MSLLHVEPAERISFVTGRASRRFGRTGWGVSRRTAMRAVTGCAPRLEALVGIIFVLFSMTRRAILDRDPRILCVRIVTVGAVGVTWKRALVLGSVTRTAGRTQSAAVGLVTRRAALVFCGSRRLACVTARALETACLRMVRKVLMTFAATSVTRVLVRSRVLTLMTIAAERGFLHALHERVRLMALDAGQILLTMPMVPSHGCVTV